LGVFNSTLCGRPSPETTDSWIARNAGEDTVLGLRTPPARITNVAGRRTFVAPPAGLVGVVAVVPPAGLEAEPLEVAPLWPPVTVELLLADGRLVVVECPEPPQAASRNAGTSVVASSRRLTSGA
jgi:hypothetical protein